ncbi:hypothetical protein Poly30_02380 [Planctomycetes bacterium Poly30]|uniref:Uncharacterized protein n=1 Tax=Saltatorellus ferox TaxID=2528018 RepID=A0A518EKX5_9BACT|nr:hypothetical protein Poly30_02380 [Planctomycetes bacterium Poly30]
MLLWLLSCAACSEEALSLGDEPAAALAPARSLLSSFQEIGAPVVQVSSVADRRPLLGTHSCNDGLMVTSLILDQRGESAEPSFAWFRMDSYCGQIDEANAGTWDLVDGEVQLYPSARVDPIRHRTLATSRILLVDGKLKLIENNGASQAMSWEADTYRRQ